jgi:hypothetical protein
LGSAGVPITAIFFLYLLISSYNFIICSYHFLSVLTFGFRFLVADGCGQGCEFRCPFGVVPCALHMLMPIIDVRRPDVCYVQLVSKCVLILVGARQLSTLRCSTLLGISCHSFVVSTSWPTNDDFAVSVEFFKR